MKAFDVVALGELLIDFTQNGVSDQGNPVFEANPGAARRATYWRCSASWTSPAPSSARYKTKP